MRLLWICLSHGQSNPSLGCPLPANEYILPFSCLQEDTGDALVYTSLPIPLPLKRQLVEEWEAISNVSSSRINTFTSH